MSNLLINVRLQYSPKPVINVGLTFASASLSQFLPFCLYLIVILQGEQGEQGDEGKRGMDGPPGIKVPLM